VLQPLPQASTFWFEADIMYYLATSASGAVLLPEAAGLMTELQPICLFMSA
jgi:hypothetical protein